MKEHEFELSEALNFADDKGDVTDGTTVVLSAPRAKNRKTTTKLKQMFFRALPDTPSGNAPQETKEEIEISGAEVLFLIAHSPVVDYPDFIETGRMLICDRNAKIGGQYFTTAMADQIPTEDLENMVGEYVGVFIVRSAMRAVMAS